MTRYDLPQPHWGVTMVWDKNLTPWRRRDDDMWEQVTDAAYSETMELGRLALNYGPLFDKPLEAVEDIIQSGETYFIRTVNTDGMSIEDLPQKLKDGKTTIIEGVYGLEKGNGRTYLVPVNNTERDIQFIKETDISTRETFILGAEELVSIPKDHLRDLLTAADDAVEKATQWYTETYGKDPTL